MDGHIGRQNGKALASGCDRGEGNESTHSPEEERIMGKVNPEESCGYEPTEAAAVVLDLLDQIAGVSR